MMSGQRSIKSFFKAANAKALSTENKSPNISPVKTDTAAGDRKRPRSDNGDDEEASPTKSPLSPDQKKRMLANRTKGLILQQCKKMPGALHKDIGPSWFEALKPEFEKPYFASLSEFLSKERSGSVPIFPPAEDVWSWTRDFPLSETKVVIIGQDPYHGPGQAHGLCFSVRKGVAVPPSLLNMYKELESDIEGFERPGHGYLQGWAEQGVLLLNACLTVRKAQANSHKDKGWERITEAVIKKISDECSGVVFLLWGNFAQKKASVVDKTKHHLLKSVHPSPLSAHRGFLGCKHFSQCNQLLEKAGKDQIDWKRLP